MEELMIGTPNTRISLIARLSDISDHDAWREFAALYEPFIHRQGRRFGLQPADARELVQEVLIAVSKAVRNFEVSPDRGRFRTWLYAVGRNVCLRYLAKLRSRELSGQNSELTALLNELPNRESADTGELNIELQRHFFLAMSRQVRGEFQPNTWSAFWQTAVEDVGMIVYRLVDAELVIATEKDSVGDFNGLFNLNLPPETWILQW